GISSMVAAETEAAREAMPRQMVHNIFFIVVNMPDCKSARIHMKQEKVSINSTSYSCRENTVVWNKAPEFFKHAFLQQRSKFQNILLTPDLQSVLGRNALSVRYFNTEKGPLSLRKAALEYGLGTD
ncbi:hypothetical protein, partial [Akkermansia sp. KLE1798]|uniref:hypothetical protein n=2 Tax=Akkermansia TaxID=239934 RepID=UPI00079A7AD8